ncbi:DUF1127 domain-containing protein [Celeribacter litoreus]|uniref:DUF1127 domain-containing protein n=1 Tax=Celeribacter litoreus TaxID=2876714 RepID=UPI001CCEB668|nr:DUF1127 domain-containing protein [Celeribacter litoreus]MCA0042942.1 DUF1127 domain-containing protein [Celeribacter litoreus]
MQTLSLSLRSGARRAPSLFSRFLNSLELRRQRKALAALDDALLEDIGLTREDAIREAQRPSWDAPCHWMK